MQTAQNGAMPSLAPNINLLAQQIDMDLLLLNSMNLESPEFGRLPTFVHNKSELSRLLTQRNSAYNYSSQQRQKDQDWIVSKRVDLGPLIMRVRNAGSQISEQDSERGKQQSSHFYIGQKELRNQAQCFYTIVDYSAFSMVQSALADDSGLDILRTKRKLLKNSNIQLPSQNSIPNPVSKMAKNQLKGQVYMKTIEQLFAIEQQLMDNSWGISFKSATKLKLWQILHNLIPKDQPKRLLVPTEQNYQARLSKVALLSLKMVESQLNAMLPSNYSSIASYLTTHYLRKIPGKYETKSTLGPVWGMAYLLYKTGRRQQFYEYLPDTELRKMFRLVDESILAEKPQRIVEAQQNGDIFHDQLVYALSGSPRYAAQCLCDPTTLDIAWVFLRNVGIFQQSNTKFTALQKDLAKSYKESSTDETKIRNLLYLLCMDELVSMGPNELMDQDDYLHFLITLYWTSSLRGLCRDVQQLQHKLTQRLGEHVQVLLEQDRKECIYYIALVPAKNIAKEISTIICTTRKLDKVKWRELQKYLQKQVYEELVRLTTSKYAQMYQDYILAAERVGDLIKDWDTALVLLIKMSIRKVVGSVDSRDMARANNLAKHILGKDEKLMQQYGPVLQFFKQHQTLLTYMEQRDEHKIYNFLKKAQHILISDHLRLETHKVLAKMMEIGESEGFDCYMQYMIDVVKGYEIALSRMARLHDLQDLQRMTLSALTGLIQSPDYEKFAKRDNVKVLMTMLEQGIYRYG